MGNGIGMIEEEESCFKDKEGMKMVVYEEGVKVDFKV